MNARLAWHALYGSYRLHGCRVRLLCGYRILLGQCISGAGSIGIETGGNRSRNTADACSTPTLNHRFEATNEYPASADYLERAKLLAANGNKFRRTMMDKQHTWFVTFEVPGSRAKRRSPRSTRGFSSEAQAKDFAREKFDQGLIVSAGTMVPHSPRKIIPPTGVPAWLDPVELNET